MQWKASCWITRWTLRGKVDFCVWFFLKKKMVEDVETKRETDSYILLTVPLGWFSALKLIPPKPRGFGDEYHDDLFMMASSCFHPSLFFIQENMWLNFIFLLVMYRKKSCDSWLQGGQTYPNWEVSNIANGADNSESFGFWCFCVTART